MKRSFASYFVDPDTHEPLSLEVISGTDDLVESGFLRNTSTGKEFPIVRGIPRFINYKEDNYSKSFGYQWNKWPKVQFESENIGKPMEGHTRLMWERIVGFNERSLDLRGRTIVDIGCGSGRFIDVTRSKGAKVIGVDYSAAVERAKVNFTDDQDVCICQADALKLPIRTNSVDGAFTIGVLHHTPNPKKGVEEAYRILNSHGWFAISVYGKGGYYDFPTVQLWRHIFKMLCPFLGQYPPMIYTYFTNYVFRPIALAIPFLGNAIRVFFPFVKLPDRNWSLLDTFDSITPSYQSAHESYEVFVWLKESGYKGIEPSNWGFTAFSGVKEAAEQGTKKSS